MKRYSTQFQRHVYHLLESNRYKILHYICDESVVKPTAHGNSKSGNPTKPTVIEKIKSEKNAEMNFLLI